MNKDLEELIQFGEQFEKKYDEMMKSEKMYNDNLTMELEYCHFETIRTLNNIREINRRL
jgi:hypothetical protein